MSSEGLFNFDFGTKPSTSELQEIDVVIDPKVLISDFAVAYVNEIKRRNPIRAEAVKLTADELREYFKALVALRVHQVRDTLSGGDWRKMKSLYIPAWIETVLSMIGKVIDRQYGLVLMPEYDVKIAVEDLFPVSEKLASFLPDGLVLHKDAFPRSEQGDVDVMSMTILNNYVCGRNVVQHPISTYIAAFLGFKLKQEAEFKMLYRVKYDDIDFIKLMILAEKSILQ